MQKIPYVLINTICFSGNMKKKNLLSQVWKYFASVYTAYSGCFPTFKKASEILGLHIKTFLPPENPASKTLQQPLEVLPWKPIKVWPRQVSHDCRAFTKNKENRTERSRITSATVTSLSPRCPAVLLSRSSRPGSWCLFVSGFTRRWHRDQSEPRTAPAPRALPL